MGIHRRMARASRGPVGLVLLVVALVALTAIALVPRGVVRTVAVGQLATVGGTEPPAGVNDHTTRAVHLPGVRALINKEEHDPAAELLDRLVAVEPAHVVAHPSTHPTGSVGTTGAAPELADPAARHERGPPTSI
jgi:hypothetical protein